MTSLQLPFLKKLVGPGQYYGFALYISRDVSIYVYAVPLATWDTLLVVTQRTGQCIMWRLAWRCTCQVEKQLPTLQSRKINLWHVLWERSRFVFSRSDARYINTLVLCSNLRYMVLLRQMVLYILFITASGFIPGGSGTIMTHNTQ